MREVVYCKDCPNLRMCRDEDRSCDWTRWIHKTVSEAPPLTEDQLRTVITILRNSRLQRPDKSLRRQPDSRLGPYRCQVPGCNAAPLKHSGTLWQHVRGVHGTTMSEYREKYGDPVPLTPEEQAALVVEAKCDVEGCGKTYSTARGNRFPHQALISHLWGHHGIKRS